MGGWVAAGSSRQRVANGSSVRTISLPKGISETGMSLKFAMPSGIPMIVTHRAMPVKMWPSASHQLYQDHPQDVADEGAAPGVMTVDDGVAEGPEGVDADAERGHAEGDSDDRDAEQEPRGDVAEEHPESAQDQPYDVQDCLHGRYPAICSSRAMRSAMGGWVENILDMPWPGRNGFAIIM